MRRKEAPAFLLMQAEENQSWNTLHSRGIDALVWCPQQDGNAGNLAIIFKDLTNDALLGDSRFTVEERLIANRAQTSYSAGPASRGLARRGIERVSVTLLDKPCRHLIEIKLKNSPYVVGIMKPGSS